MILTDEEVSERLTSDENIINLVKPSGSVQIKALNDTGIGNRGPAIPDMIRKLIAQTTNASDESKTEIANVFSVGVPEVSKYSRGLVQNRLDEELQEISNKTKAEKAEAAHDLALDSLISSLGLVAEKKDTITTAKEAASIAVSMSRVVKELKGDDPDSDRAKTLVIIKMPNMKMENQFETIDV